MTYSAFDKAFTLAAQRHKTSPDDVGVQYERMLMQRIIDDPSYLLMLEWPASILVHTKTIHDLSVDAGQLADNLLWQYGTHEDWLLRTLARLGDSPRDAHYRVTSSIRTLYRKTNDTLLRTPREKIAEQVEKYTAIMTLAHYLMNDRVAQATTRLEDIQSDVTVKRIAASVPDTLDALFSDV